MFIVLSQEIKNLLRNGPATQAPTTDAAPPLASDQPDTAVTLLLLDEYITTIIQEALAEALLQWALEVQEMPWNKSKIMFVGPGRAGKTGTMRSMLGHNDRAAMGLEEFEQTASTVGIDNDWSCEVVQETTVVDGDATFESGDNRWISSMTSKQDKAKRNYESALAGVIAAIKQGRMQEAVQVATKAAQTLSDNTAAAAVARYQEQPSKTKGDQKSNSSGGSKEGGMTVASTTHNDGSLATGGGGGGVHDDAALLLPDLTTKSKESLDSDFFMLTMMERLKINEKLSISLVDFGGQRVFGAVHGLFMNKYGIYLLCFSMVSWLADQQQCEKDIKMWINSVVVYTGTITDDHDLQPAPILLVGTHKDQVVDVTVHRRISDSIKGLFGDRHPMWKNLHENDAQKLVFFPVDNTQGTCPPHAYIFPLLAPRYYVPPPLINTYPHLSLSVCLSFDVSLGRHDPVIQDLMKRSETIIENEDYVKAKQPLVYMQVLDLIQDANRSCLLYSEVVSFAKVWCSSVLSFPIVGMMVA